MPLKNLRPSMYFRLHCLPGSVCKRSHITFGKKSWTVPIRAQSLLSLFPPRSTNTSSTRARTSKTLWVRPRTWSLGKRTCSKTWILPMGWFHPLDFQVCVCGVCVCVRVCCVLCVGQLHLQNRTGPWIRRVLEQCKVKREEQALCRKKALFSCLSIFCFVGASRMFLSSFLGIVFLFLFAALVKESKFQPKRDATFSPFLVIAMVVLVSGICSIACI